MVPIHDTDIAESRWSQAEWENYELQEKIDVRARRKKSIWVAIAAFVFILLSSVPIILDRAPKWRALSAARLLGQELGRMKRDAAIDHQAYRVSFDSETLKYRVDRASACKNSQFTKVRDGSLVSSTGFDKFLLLSPERGRKLGLPGLITAFCYDPIEGSEITPRDGDLFGFGIAPDQDVNSLTDSRLDRVAVLFVRGPSAEISFE